MKTVPVTRAQKQALELLSSSDIAALRKNPRLVSGSKHLLVACKKVIKRVEKIPRHASPKRRETAYKRIVELCKKAIDRVEG